MLTFVALFVSIAGEVDFGHLDWRVECDCCRRGATTSACCFFLSPCAPMLLRATLFRITSLVSIMTTSWLSSSNGVEAFLYCQIEGADQCLGVCDKPLLDAWTLDMMLENGILPRKHAYLKLRNDPGNFRSRHSPLSDDTLITQIEGPTMHLQLFIQLLVVLIP